MASSKPAFFTVAESFLDAASDTVYHKGEVVAADDPILKKKGNEGRFVPLIVREHLGGVEKATAAPGEKRG